MNLDFNDISVHIGHEKILSNISGQVQAGKITAIIGPNGAGKSTLLSALSGLRAINTGNIQISDNDIHAMDMKERAQLIGYLPQRNEVNWNISVRHIVALGRIPHNSHKDDHEKAIQNAMLMVNVHHLADRKSAHLSGGELSRVLFARLLAGEPEWILLDEPMANLDLAHQLDMAKLLKTLRQKGKSIIIILHDLQQAAQLADNIIIMNSGCIHAIGTTSQALTRHNLNIIFGVDAQINNNGDNMLNIGNFTRIPSKK